MFKNVQPSALISVRLRTRCTSATDVSIIYLCMYNPTFGGFPGMPFQGGRSRITKRS